MPDANKFYKLEQIHYTVRRCCLLCVYGDFSDATERNPFGSCRLHTYRHAKHSGPPRGVSIVLMGSCADIDLEGVPLGPPLGSHAGFLEEP